MLGSNPLTSTRGAIDKSLYGAMQAMGVHLFRGESTGPKTDEPPRSTCPRIGGPGVHRSSDTATVWSLVPTLIYAIRPFAAEAVKFAINR